MATTGADIFLYLQQKVGHAYTGYLDTFKANRLLRNATIDTIEQKYRALSNQGSYDELKFFINTETEFALAGNRIFIEPNIGNPLINDYLHLLAVKVYYEEPLFLSFSTLNTTPLGVVFGKRNNLRSGEQIRITGVTTNTAANGVFFLKKFNEFKFGLYTDANLQNPVVSAGTSTGGNIFRVFYEYCKQYISDAKIGVLNTPTPAEPRFEIANQQLKFYPRNLPAQKITIDYIKKIAAIDTANTTLDMEQFYNLPMIMAIINTADNIFAQMVRDGELYNTSAREVQTKP